MQQYAMTLSEQAKELKNEKQQTDNLLYQMIPKSVAERLKDKSEVLVAEAYQCVTIFFSDIAGFYQVNS